ncbi:nucleotidyltransferase domain-containing protein [Bosea sp. CS1GBMeth4]|uniref:nucleotidyltransferase domain-containing protein n=1 Tax=Bosea sp. CS1GBMeth4 TaxID=1892849 RepID=UPI001647C301|nr:nucleotidyltransferase domain-containing protein [Bosea sp. CS1GBMeth4]
MPSTLPKVHTEFLVRTRDAVASDERFIALLIGGSYIHGGLDEQSDLDFVIIVEDDSYADVMASRMRFAEALGGLLSAFTGEHVGEPRLLICLYGPPLLHVDFKFTLASDLDRQIERRTVLFARDPAAIEQRMQAGSVAWPNLPSEWFEARAWVWLHYAATKLARGELYEAIGMLGFFREQVLGPLLYRRTGRDQRGVRRLEALGLDTSDKMAATVARHEAASVADAIKASIDCYLDLRADDPMLKPTRGMPELLYDFIDRAVLPSGGAAPRE